MLYGLETVHHVGTTLVAFPRTFVTLATLEVHQNSDEINYQRCDLTHIESASNGGGVSDEGIHVSARVLEQFPNHWQFWINVNWQWIPAHLKPAG